MDEKLVSRFARITDEEQMLLDGSELDKTVYASGSRFVVDKSKLLARGRLITIRPHTRFVDFPSHSHNYVEIVYMLRGETRHVINGATPLTLRAGELLMMNQHVRHSISRAERDDVAVNFIVLPQFFDTTLDIIGPDNPLGSFLLGGLAKTGSDISHLHFKVAEMPEVQNLIENMLRGFIAPRAHTGDISRLTMGLLFLHLLDQAERLEMRLGGRGSNALVVECLREIEDGYATASLSRIAEKYGVSVTYLSNLVKDSTGHTFKALLQEKRLARAEALLRDTKLTVQEVIAGVGYQNTSYFYRIFTEKYGTVPKTYRAAARNE